MGLTEYNRKRDFKKTKEPAGKKTVKRGHSFVIQKHAASHLHYDFRLELDGVLKSWAVPKGPSLDPSQKRLAVHVEDHPVAYGSFEGIIPEGEYGGGTVMLWDRGTWHAIGDAHADYLAGKLKFTLQGEKLHGAWALIRTGGHGDARNWLLFKERDDQARPAAEYDITASEPLSVSSHRDLAEIAAAKDNVWSSNRTTKAAANKAKPAAKLTKTAIKAVAKKSLAKAKSRAPRGGNTFLKDIEPQLATLVDQAPEGDEWLHEIKFDGYRMLCYIDGEHATLHTRNNLDWTAKMRELAEASARIKVRQAVLDGEVVALNERGVSDFGTLQQSLQDHSRRKLIYYVFDVLYLDGQDLRSLPLEERKQHLASLKLPTDRGSIRYAEHVVGAGAEFFAEAARLGLEGIISKRRDKPYQAGRGGYWLKAKCAAESEFVIGGYTDPGGARSGFGALLLGYHEKPGRLVYAGRVGTGFDDKLLASLGKKLKALEIGDRPFESTEPKSTRGVHWVKPELVGQVRFTNWTRDGMLRHPAFLGLREDKPARTVTREDPVTPKQATQGKGALGGKRKSDAAAKDATKTKNAANDKGAVKVDPPTRRRAAAKKSAAIEPASNTSTAGEAKIGGVRVTHPGKLLFPDKGLSKQDVAEYYLAVAEWMLPHVVGRPLSIVRCPDGSVGECFFQKHHKPGSLDDMRRIAIREKTARREYVVIERAEDLVSLVQIGALELHIWGSTIDAIEKPDRLVFDLDPAPELEWKTVVGAAKQVRKFLQDLGLESFVKTTGGKGLHLVTPIAKRHDWDFVADFCRKVAEAIARAAPNEYVSVMSKAKRTGKIFIDYLRNQRGATAVAPFSTRARPGATVSMPLSWAELTINARPDKFRVDNSAARMRKLSSDPWAEIGNVRQSLSASMLKRLES